MEITQMKPLLTSEELIVHMESRGITFNHISRERALSFLKSNNNYFKLTSYRKNFPKYAEGKDKGKYIDLDFAYLIDLSTIDMYLRHILLKMTLDIEHYIKVNLMVEVENNPFIKDGYQVVREFIDSQSSDKGDNKVVVDIRKNAGSPYCGELLEKYNISFDSNVIEDFPVWAFIEVISFGTLKAFYKFYNDKYQRNKNKEIVFLLQTVNQLRNAAAHNNCILNNLYPIQSKNANINFHRPNYKVLDFISNAGIEKLMRTNKMSNPRLKQIVTMLYVFDKIVTSNDIKRLRYEELFTLIKHRMKRDLHYYDKNPTIITTFQFLEQIITYLYTEIEVDA